jgi:Cupin-like domain
MVTAKELLKFSIRNLPSNKSCTIKNISRVTRLYANSLTKSSTIHATMDPTSTPPDPIIELLTTYWELNSSTIDELTELPSALEFMRYVALNRPFVVRGGASDWTATQTWDVGTLKRRLEGQSVNVAVTPKGYPSS